MQGLDTKLIWDGCTVEITTAEGTYVKPITETGLINIVETDVDFNEPGVYPVYIKGEEYEIKFAVQVITENFYEETKQILLDNQ